MKHTILSVLISLTSLGFCYGQLNLERTYGLGPLSEILDFGRVYLENSGEKYYVVFRGYGEPATIQLYNADHTWWKTINLPSSKYSNVTVKHLSESRINPDVQLEILCGDINSSAEMARDVGIIINESGDALLESGNSPGAVWDGSESELSRLPGLPDKLITRSTSTYYDGEGIAQVWSLPELHLEHTYVYRQRQRRGSFKRILLENSGEKYYYVDQTKNQIRLHNPDHTLWKTISLTPALEYNSLIYDLHLSESTINSDDKVEVCYVYETAGICNIGIINEDGAVLLEEEERSLIEFKISELSDRPDKLILNLTDQIQIYSLPGLRLEHTYTTTNNNKYPYPWSSHGEYGRVLLESSGEKYYYLDNGQLRLFNADHSPWKTISLPTPDITFAESFHIIHLSDNILNKDNQIEIIYGYGNNSTNTHLQAIANEDGIIQSFSSGSVIRLHLSEIPGLPDKLFVSDRTVGRLSSRVRVYSLPLIGVVSSLAGGNPARAVSIYPNPVSSGAIHVACRAARLDKLSIQTVGGQTVVNLDNYTSDTPIDISSLREGVYIITGQQDSELWFSERFVVY